MGRKNLAEELDKSEELPDRTKLILMLAPGCLFGFPPDNLEDIVDRVDCPHCLVLINRHIKLGKQICNLKKNFERSIAHKNEQQLREYRNRSFLYRFFVEPPKPHDPQDWYENYKKEERELLSQTQLDLKDLAKTDPNHWGNTLTCNVSKLILGIALGAGNWEIITTN